MSRCLWVSCGICSRLSLFLKPTPILLKGTNDRSSGQSDISLNHAIPKLLEFDFNLSFNLLVEGLSFDTHKDAAVRRMVLFIKSLNLETGSVSYSQKIAINGLLVYFGSWLDMSLEAGITNYAFVCQMA